MSTQFQIIYFDLLPSTSHSPKTPTGNLFHRTLLSLQQSHTHLIWSPSTTSPLRILILLETTDPSITATLLSPLTPLLAQSPIITTLPSPAGSPITPILPPANLPTDILTFTFPPTTALTEEFIFKFKKAVDLLFTFMPTAILPAGRDYNPCTIHLDAFEAQDRKAYVWISWNSEEERESFRSGMGERANLGVMMWTDFQGCHWKEMGDGLWKPLMWLGAEVEEDECWVFREVEEGGSEGWFRWMGRWVGWSG